MSHKGSAVQIALSVSAKKNFCWTGSVLGGKKLVFLPAKSQE